MRGGAARRRTESDGGPGRARAGQQARKLAKRAVHNAYFRVCFACFSGMCCWRMEIPISQNLSTLCSVFSQISWRIGLGDYEILLLRFDIVMRAQEALNEHVSRARVSSKLQQGSGALRQQRKYTLIYISFCLYIGFFLGRSTGGLARGRRGCAVFVSVSVRFCVSSLN